MVTENAGRWLLRAEVPNREPDALVIGDQTDDRPEWWLSGNVRAFLIHGTAAGPNATTAPPQVRIRYGVPFTAYINPIQNKADRSQDSSDHPFVIGIDVQELPGAFEAFRKELPAFFSNWGSRNSFIR